MHMGVSCMHSARRIPCACDNCREIISKDWVSGLEPDKQPRFQSVLGCKHRDILGSLNDWQITSTSNKQESLSVEEMEEENDDEKEAEDV